MAIGLKRPARYRTRREAERALSEILEDGGHKSEFRIHDLPDGGCVIIVLEQDGEVAGTIGV